MTRHSNLESALDSLAEDGIDLVAFVPAEAGPATAIPARMREQPLEEGLAFGLLLFVARGARFARRTEFHAPGQGDPFDARARALVEAFLDRVVRPFDPGAELAYPLAGSEGALDLRAWLEAGRLQFVAPFRTGVRPDCGPWLAVRGAAWAALDDAARRVLERRAPALSPEAAPCTKCVERPCVAACPVGALDQERASLERCIEHRLQADSSCADRCHARLACPVGAEARYPEPVLRYHYGVSLITLRTYRDTLIRDER